jgi:hypothetical protein
MATPAGPNWRSEPTTDVGSSLKSNVVPITVGHSFAGSSAVAFATNTPVEQTSFDWRRPPDSKDEIPIEALYPALEVGSRDFVRSQKLLKVAIDRINKASQSLDEGDPIAADLAMQRVYALLPELFSCRSLGDGFGAAVNALQSSIENLHGLPMVKAQTKAVAQVFATIKAKPFLTFDAAMDEVTRLEEAGLTTEPIGYAPLVDWLDGESFR